MRKSTGGASVWRGPTSAEHYILTTETGTCIRIGQSITAPPDRLFRPGPKPKRRRNKVAISVGPSGPHRRFAARVQQPAAPARWLN